MSSLQQACAIIPAYREERFIRSVVSAVRNHLPTVFVIDDCSPDKTGSEAAAAGATVIRHAVNQGKGAAIKTGLRAAAEHGLEYYFFLDGDGQHDPEEIPRFWAELQRNAGDLIVGNRMNDLASMPLVRKWTNLFMSWQIGRICGRPLPDTQCGFRLANRRMLETLLESSDGFAFETETLLLAAERGYHISFVPVRTIYRDEVSKIRPVRDTFRYIRILAKYQKAARERRLAANSGVGRKVSQP
jgi:glycosyltransferase involved in cell wall biosynthesis